MKIGHWFWITLCASALGACSSGGGSSDAGSPDVPATDVPATDVPATDTPTTDTPTTDTPTTDAPTTDVPVDAGATTPDVVRTCTLLHACGFAVPDVGATAGECVRTLAIGFASGGTSWPFQRALAIARLLECGRTARTCDALRACYTHDLWTPSLCTGPRSRCVGDRVVSCSASSDPFPQTIDCAEYGMPCVAGACVPPATGPADPTCTTAGASRCNGDAVEVCTQRSDGSFGVFRRDCAAAGLRCGRSSFPGSNATCLPLGGACATAGVACDGTALTMCSTAFTPTQQTFRFDCASVGRGCGPSTSGPLTCVPTGTECSMDPATFGGSCDHDSLVLCADGHTLRVACADVGRRTCGMSSVGVPSCVP